MIDALRRLHLERRARAAALVDVDARARVARETYGEDPTNLAKGSLELREATETLAARGLIRDLEEQRLRLLNLRTVIGDSRLWTAALIGLVVVESWGAMTLLKTMGMSAEERRFPAIALALALIGLTKAVAGGGGSPPKGGEAPPKDVASLVASVPWRTALVAVIYTLLIGALVVVRVFADADEEAVTAVSWAEGIVAIAVTAGPAWVAAYVAKRRVPAAELSGRIEIVERSLAAAKSQERKARRFVTNLDRASAQHRDAVGRADAAVSLAYDRAQATRRATALLPDNPDPET